MIRYTLICENGHDFESWFQSAEGYERLAAAGKAPCPECGSTSVRKALMAPPVAARSGTPAALSERGPAPVAAASPDPESLRARAVAELRRMVERESTDVGRSFAREARAIHEGRAEARPIHGEAAPAEARALIEEGVPVLPLPFKPRRKMN